MVHQILLLDIANEPEAGLGARLAQCGFRVQTASNIESAVRVLCKHSPALAVVQIGDATGVDLHRTLRMLSSVPIMVVCRQRDEDLIVRCLKAGADTVLVAPISRRELVARIGAVLSRSNGSPPEPGLQSPSYQVGDLVVDPHAHVVTKGGFDIALTPTEFRLLVALARREEKVVSHVDLLSEVWGPTHLNSPETLRLYIRYLRQKLEEDYRQPRLLLSQRGVGYRLTAGAASTNDGESYGR